jgi:ParB family chromosome partitioning protein
MDHREIELRNVRLDEILVMRQWRVPGNIDWLTESIAQHGLLHPISITSELHLVAGWHRLEAFRRLGRATIPAFILDQGSLGANMLAIDENLVRKELTALERADLLNERKQLYEVLHPDTRCGGDRGNQHTGGKKRQTAESAFCLSAKVWSGQSSRTVRQYILVSRRLTPDAKQAIRGTKLEDSITELGKIARLAPAIQLGVAYELQRNSGTSVRRALENFNRDRQHAPCSELLPSEMVRLILGDFRHVGQEVQDGSVSLVLTDPPYSTEALPLFNDLGAFAARVLRPGGSMLCMVAATHLPLILQALTEHLTYQWTCVYVQGGPGTIVHARRVCSAHKLFVWFVKGKYEGHPFTDVIFGPGPDKRFHPWGQSQDAFDLLIERYTKPMELVVDPFLGGGTTGAAAQKLGRRFVGIEINTQSLESARIRTGA